MSRQRKRDQRSRLDLQVQLADLLVKVNDWNDTTSQSVAMGLMLLNLSYADLLPETTRVMSSIEMEQWLVQLAAIPFMETYAVCKHTASALRKYSDEERTVAPTFRSFKHSVCEGLRPVILEPIKVEVSQYLKYQAPDSLARTLTWVEFITRIPIDDPTLVKDAELTS